MALNVRRKENCDKKEGRTHCILIVMERWKVNGQRLYTSAARKVKQGRKNRAEELKK